MSSIDDNVNDKPTPLSSSFSPASWSSNLGVADAIASYRRSQVIITGQSVSSRSTYVPQDDEPTDEEAALQAAGPSEQVEDADPVLREGSDFVSDMGWEEELQTPSASTPTSQLRFPGTTHGRSASVREHKRSDKQRGKAKQQPTLPITSSSAMSSTERTPLLPSRSSTPSAFVPGTPSSDKTVTPLTTNTPREYLSVDAAQAKPLSRRPSAVLIKTEKPIAGRSTFGQTLFNSVAILLGFGMLSEPLAFAYAGWVGGVALVIAYGYVTCYTAKILAGFMLEDSEIHTYADIGIKAFGRKSRFITSTLFCLELLAVCVVLITLYGDSLHSIAPSHSANTYKLIGLVILTPTLFMPLSVLSYASMIGIFSTLLVIFVLFYDGLTKVEAPGSLWDPATTSWEPASLGKIGVAFGLFMAGFSGHAVLPSLARDMKDPELCDKMFNWAFTAATVIYALIGGCGYLMFGNDVSDEVSQDLLLTPGYNLPLNRLVMWSLVIMPLTKFALSTRPVNITLEILLGIHQPNSLKASIPMNPAAQASRRILVPVLTAIERILFAALAVSISIFIPEFSSMMAFLGSFSAFMLCVIGPVSAKIALSEQKGVGMFDAFLLVSGVVMAAWGTYAAFAV